MEETNTQSHSKDDDSTESQAPDEVSVVSNAPIVYSTTPKKLSQSVRHRRELSVDMLSNEQAETSENGAYLTPRSGISSTASTAMIGEEAGAVSSASTQTADLPSIDEQISRVRHLVLQQSQEGQKGYIVAMKWLGRVLSRGSNVQDAEKCGKEAREGPIGPVDNTGINLILDPSSHDFKDQAGEPYVPLKPGLQISEDFEIVPQDAWDLIIKWYGLAKGSPVITRYCHNTSMSEVVQNLQFELNPPLFTILKLPDNSAGVTAKVLEERNAAPIKVLASRLEYFQTFLKKVKKLAGVELKTKVRLWRILGGLGKGAQAGLITPAQSRSSSPAPNIIVPVDSGDQLVLDVNTFASLQLGSQRELVDARDETNNEKYNGHVSLDVVGLRQDDVVVLEEQIGGPAGGEWVSDAASRQASKNGVPISITKSGVTTVQDKLKPKANIGSGRTSPAPGGMMTRGRQQKNGRTRGTTGLSNLGNTCYMNSALQCVRSVEELTQYFLQEKYKKELNPNNPLSHNGQVAKVYASLLQEIYGENAISAIAPRNFKNVIGRYGPSFSGYGQQDSQEFLLFLLDGLQEDLNRIHKKPYIEKPDSTDEMVHNPVALREMANKCWHIYKARNDSVITDLFAGMYKSTVVCPVCDKVSIIFDPFNNLTLQLPIENVWSKSLYFFPLRTRPYRINVDIDKNASFMALKEYVAHKVGIEAKKLIIAEIYKHRFYKMFTDKASIGEERIADGDDIGIFELEDIPSNYPPPKKKVQKIRSMLYSHNSDEDEDVPEGDSPLAEKMLVPIFNRFVKDGSSRLQQRVLFGVPTYIIVSRDEAKDFDAILRKVLARIDTMTTKHFLIDENASDSGSGQEDSDTVFMSTDDGDSSSDSKLQSKSLESEDGMVDISMRNVAEESQAAPSMPSPPVGPKSKHLPHMLRPGSFIAPEVRNLFQMKYFSSGTEMIPTGWATLQDENKDYPTITSRQPEPTVERKRTSNTALSRRFQRLGSPSSSDEDVDNVPPPASHVPPLDHGSDSESDGLPVVEKLMNPGNGGFSRFNRTTPRNRNGLITYSRKGKHRTLTPNREETEHGSETDSGPLIRLGEAIVLDWNGDARESLFYGSESSEDNGMRGAATWERIPTMHDQELDKKRHLRMNRKKHGVSLGDCLDEFGKAEILSENDAWYCPRCKEHRRASKTFELWKSPDILVIHLKRFSAQGRLRDKLDVLVDFPVEGLDLGSRVAMQETGKSPIYDLFAVDNHYGGLGGGHYTAFAQNFFDKNWYEYNDSSVSRRQNPQAVVTSAAYLLFYRRRAPQALGGPFFEQIINTVNNPDSESQPPSRATSPSGEGKRLGDSSRNGSSSALRGVGAAHQAGGGGSANEMTQMRSMTDINDRPPTYSAGVREGETHLSPQQVTLESMELDEDEGIPSLEGHFSTSPYPAPVWSFDSLDRVDEEMQGMTQMTAAPPGSDQGDEEDLFDGASNRAASSFSGSPRLLTDFAEDEGTTHGVFGTPPRRDVTPVAMQEEDDDETVAEVHVTDGEDMFKMD